MHTFSSSIFVEGFLDYGLEVISGMNGWRYRKTQFFSYSSCSDDAYSRDSTENGKKVKKPIIDQPLQIKEERMEGRKRKQELHWWAIYLLTSESCGWMKEKRGSSTKREWIEDEALWEVQKERQEETPLFLLLLPLFSSVSFFIQSSHSFHILSLFGNSWHKGKA